MTITLSSPQVLIIRMCLKAFIGGASILRTAQTVKSAEEVLTLMNAEEDREMAKRRSGSGSKIPDQTNPIE